MVEPIGEFEAQIREQMLVPDLYVLTYLLIKKRILEKRDLILFNGLLSVDPKYNFFLPMKKTPKKVAHD